MEVTLNRVNGAVGQLYNQVDRADAAPTSTQTEATAAIAKELPAAMKKWAEFKSSDLAALNKQLRAANLSEIRVEASGRGDEDEGGDVE